jgi:hypothetical protein
MSRAYGRRYVVQMRSSLEVRSYSAAHRRQGLASVTTIKWRALCGEPRYSWIVTATDGGCMYATTMTVRHISMANCALVLAFLGRRSCSRYYWRDERAHAM